MPRRSRPPAQALRGSPFLTHVEINPERVDPDAHPFTLPLLAQGLELEFSVPVTFFVGEKWLRKVIAARSPRMGRRLRRTGRLARQFLHGRRGRTQARPGAEARLADHYRITRDFLNAPERYYRYLLEDDEESSSG
jgi:hypothetical protein